MNKKHKIKNKLKNKHPKIKKKPPKEAPNQTWRIQKNNKKNFNTKILKI